MIIEVCFFVNILYNSITFETLCLSYCGLTMTITPTFIARSEALSFLSLRAIAKQSR